jgi:hypothetical protein
VEKEVTTKLGDVTRPNGVPPPKGRKTHADGNPPVHNATEEQFKKAQEKTSKLHAGLFRRLAQ